MCKRVSALFLSWMLLGSVSFGAELFVEAEAFGNHGGWTLDTQFIDIMGSPYLLAHGLGKPVQPAVTKIAFPAAGEYRVWVRTKDWVAPWKAPGSPGKFKLAIDGKPLETTFGTVGAEWHWHEGGKVTLTAGEHELSLVDLTGFDGRCDAIYFSTDSAAKPPETRGERRKLRGFPETPAESEPYDLVVCGGGYSGLGAAISAARQGLKVALIQNRPVLGGNGSSEVQVWAQGGTKRGLYPRLGEIVEEFADRAKNSPGEYEEYGDAKKEAIVRAEKNIDLLLNTHVIGVNMSETADRKIASVTTLDTRTGEERRLRGAFFADCTGHGTVGALANASFVMLEKGHLGMSNMWKWEDAGEPQAWQETPWALPLELGDFPATKAAANVTKPFHKGEWFWESGFDKHPVQELESMRDWNLRAVFGAFSAMKNGPQAEKHRNSYLTWVAAIGGTRESRLLVGDVVLTAEDIVGKREFPDGCVPTTWDLDLHYPKEQFMKKFPNDPFISRAQFGKGVDRKEGYPIPYRCFFSKDVNNLFMAGRCISVNHEALGTIRVMRTCGMMGEVVGKAAYVCVKEKTSPRGVYDSHLETLKDLMRQPGAARRESLTSALKLPEGETPSKPINSLSELSPPTFAKPKEGIFIDDAEAKFTGDWSSGESLEHAGSGYRYASPKADASVRFEFKVPQSGKYVVRLAWTSHENRATNAQCTIGSSGSEKTVAVNFRAKSEPGFHEIGTFEFEAGKPAAITISSAGADGLIHADAAHIVPVK